MTALEMESFRTKDLELRDDLCCCDWPTFIPGGLSIVREQHHAWSASTFLNLWLQAYFNLSPMCSTHLFEHK